MNPIAIIGAGAAGMFLASNVKNTVVLEAAPKILRKLALTGGGRCNICNAQPDIKKLLQAYPRNGGRLRKLFAAFGAKEIFEWFAKRGMPLKTEDEYRVFPKCESAESVCALLEDCALKNGTLIRRNFSVAALEKFEGGFAVKSAANEVVSCKKLVVATGGNMSDSLKTSLEALGVKFVKTVPSLFAFDLSDGEFSELSGLSVKNIKLFYKKLESTGDILFTRGGVSGPAVLKMSSFGAFDFSELNYKFCVDCQFLSPEEFSAFLQKARSNFGAREIKNLSPEKIGQRLWCVLLNRAKIPQNTLYARLTKDAEKVLFNEVCKCTLSVCKRGEHKSEFVSAGGVDVSQIDFASMQCKDVENLYFIGECLDIDALTGGYNLMSCWTQAMRLAQNLREKKLAI
ncbi:MAG: aminoacetone oxidase family FAD-binding enzyme [Opitutales bacterium]|nr:aminoacetone oxidase family FAD-binding enzyme [Opitutales bacterium]